MGVYTERSWFLLQSKPHKDELAEAHLRNQDYEVYRPLAKRLRKQRGKMVKVTESLFPRYMFIYLDQGIEDNWGPIRSTTGVGSIVRFGKECLPPPVPTSLILSLQANEDALGDRAIDLDRFHKGDKVIITEGPFKGLQAVFQQYDGDNRVYILMHLLNTKRPSKMAISPAHLLAA